jgi:hypothetical protein
MARLDNDDFVLYTFQPNLQPGEGVLSHAYGLNMPMLILLGFFFLGFAVRYFLKRYLVCVTDRGRLLVLRFTGNLNVEEVTVYDIGKLQNVRTHIGPVFTSISIGHPDKPLSVKFSRMGVKQNRQMATAIVRSLDARVPPLLAV